MRVGIKLLRNGGPTEGVTPALMLRPTTGCPRIPVKGQTDDNSTWSEVVPLAIRAALNLMDNVVGPDGGSSSRNGVFEEFETRCLVDLNRLMYRGCGSSSAKRRPAPLAAVLLRSHPLQPSGWVRASQELVGP